MKCQIPQISWHGRDPVLSVDFQMSQEGEIRRLATSGTDAHVVIWFVTICPESTISIECACDLSRHNKSVNVVRFSPSGELLASGDDEGGIFIWKLREVSSQPKLEGEEEEGNKEDWFPFKLLRGHLDDICDLNWSPNGDFIVSCSVDNSVVVWDAQKGQSIRVAKEAKGFVQGVAWDPLNQYFASISSDRMVRVYSVTSQKVVQRIRKAPWVDSGEKGMNRQSKLFHDDTLQSFCRRLTFSPDGNFLMVPSGIKEKNEKLFHTTYVFSRFELNKPVFHFPTGQKYTLAVKCCPLLFQLKESDATPLVKLPYRMIIAVVTQDTVFLYDTQQFTPFAYISNIHYAHLTDLSWSSDGQIIIISSTDGYCSFIMFKKGELGEIYVPEVKPCITSTLASEDLSISEKNNKNDQNNSQEVAKENLPACLSTTGERSPRKLKTPKKLTPTSAKKPKVKKFSRDISSFFSPPGKRIKLGVSDPEEDKDCCIIFENSNKQSLDNSSKTKKLDSLIKMQVATTSVTGEKYETMGCKPLNDGSKQTEEGKHTNVAVSESMECKPSNADEKQSVECKSENVVVAESMECEPSNDDEKQSVECKSENVVVTESMETKPLSADAKHLIESKSTNAELVNEVVEMACSKSVVTDTVCEKPKFDETKEKSEPSNSSLIQTNRDTSESETMGILTDTLKNSTKDINSSADKSENKVTDGNVLATLEKPKRRIQLITIK